MPDDAPVISTDLLRKNAGAAGMRDMIHHARCAFRLMRNLRFSPAAKNAVLAERPISSDRSGSK
jgi:hypothetical protein